MRWLVLVLLVANLFYLGWRVDRESRERVRGAATGLQVPANVPKLSLLAELPETPPLRVTEPRPDDMPLPGGDSDLAELMPEITEAPAVTEGAGYSCFSYGPLPEERQAVWLGDWFRSRRAEVRSRVAEDPGGRLFWVYLAPTESLQSAMQVVENLKKRGVRDYRLISKGNLGNAVSLGLFSSQEAVNARLQELKEKGFQPVVVPYSNMQRFYWVDVRVPTMPEILDQLFDGYPSRYSSVPVQCSEIALNGSSQ